MSRERAPLTRRGVLAAAAGALGLAVLGRRASASMRPIVPISPLGRRPTLVYPPLAPPSTTTTSTTSTTSTTTTTTTTPTTTAPPPPPPTVPTVPVAPRAFREVAIGTSVQGRPIPMFVDDVDAPFRLMVVAAIHGDERGTAPVAHALTAVGFPAHVACSIVTTANPDGWAAGHRLNANGVDLNRNFPWRWAAYDGGPFELSEPETRALADLIVASGPHLVVWIHQPLAYIGPIGHTDRAWAGAWAAAAGVRRRDDVDQHGGGETWTAKVAGIPSILVEIAGRDATPETVAAHVRGFEALLQALPR